MDHYQLFVDGQFTSGHSSTRVDAIDPSTCTTIGSVPAADREDVDRARRLPVARSTAGGGSPADRIARACCGPSPMPSAHAPVNSLRWKRRTAASPSLRPRATLRRGALFRVLCRSGDQDHGDVVPAPDDALVFALGDPSAWRRRSSRGITARCRRWKIGAGPRRRVHRGAEASGRNAADDSRVRHEFPSTPACRLASSTS